MEYRDMGSCEKTRTRRSDVYALKLNGFTAPEISKSLRVPLGTIYRDIQHINNLPIHRHPDLEAERQKAIDYWLARLKYYTIKEEQAGHPNQQAAFAKLKDSAMVEIAKLLGLYVQKLEHTGSLKEQVLDWLEVSNEED